MILEMYRNQRVLRKATTLYEIASYIADGWDISTVNDVPCVGCCTFCGRPIMDGDLHQRSMTECVAAQARYHFRSFLCKDCMFTPKPLPAPLLIPERTA